MASSAVPLPEEAATARVGETYLALWDLEGPDLNQWALSVPALHGSNSKRTGALVTPDVANQVWSNLLKALQELTSKAEEKQHDGEEEEAEPPAKRSKLDESGKKTKKKQKLLLIDPFDIYSHTIAKKEEDDDDLEDIDPVSEAAAEIKSRTGGKLTQMTISGIVNGMAGVQGGVVCNKQSDAKDGYKNDTPLPSAMNVNLLTIKRLATSMHQAIQTRVETDVLVTTPIRIQEMLAPDLQPLEFKGVRKRIYDTVILGKGLNQPEVLDIATGSASTVHDIEKFKRCKGCGNNDQALFVLDRKNGDVVCSNCGTVAIESLMHEGSQFRKFEGEIDRNHHGDAPNSLYSNAHNMSTTLGGVQMTTGAGVGGFGSQKGGLETVLRNAHSYTELNISQFGKGDRRTRVGYKDKQKRDAFMQMTHCGDALNLHEAVVQRAKELFAGFRDDRELVQQFKGVIAACLCEAFDQLSNDGKQILKQKQEVPQETFTSARASKRNELHHANLAGKGGLLLDMSTMKKEKDEDLSTVSKKTAATWDLEDCRSWLMEASLSIAQQWVEDRKKGVKVPEGTLEELQGKLVEHAFTLNDTIQAETKKQASMHGANGRKRVVTPRINDMAKLGIKWQHSHERGSGGKGGVGNSGSHKVTAPTSGRTAGQILILKTAKKIGLLLKDSFAGEAIHKELRALIKKQEAQKSKKLRDEATRQRFAQMKRKPWLQARAESET